VDALAGTVDLPLSIALALASARSFAVRLYP
jgi:hypothetical protein